MHRRPCQFDTKNILKAWHPLKKTLEWLFVSASIKDKNGDTIDLEVGFNIKPLQVILAYVSENFSESKGSTFDSWNFTNH